jgi:hypothetical protein
LAAARAGGVPSDAVDALSSDWLEVVEQAESRVAAQSAASAVLVI